MRINPVKTFNNSVVLKNNAKIKHQKISFGADSFEKKSKKDKNISLLQRRKMLSEFKKIGLKDCFKAFSLSDDEFLKFVDFLKNEEEKAQFAFQYSKLDERQTGLYKYLKQRSVNTEYALKATDYTNEELNRFADIFQQYSPSYMTHEAVKFEEKKFARFKELLDDGTSFIGAYEVASLDDEEYEKAIKIKNKGFRALFAADVVKDDEIYELLNSLIDEKIDMRILDVAFKQSVNFSKIKQDIKHTNPKDVIANMAVLNVSKTVLEYFDNQIKEVKDNPNTVLDKTGKVLEYTIDDKKNEIKCLHAYNKKGEIQQVTYSSSKNNPLILNFTFDNKKLSKMTYLRNNEVINFDVKSPEFVTLFDTEYGVKRIVNTLLLVDSAQHLHDEEFENLNNFVFGEQDEETCEAKKDFNNEFPNILLHVDNSMDVKYIKRLKEALKTQPKEEMPKRIFLTTFLPYNTSGEFMHQDTIAIAPSKDMDFFDITIYHELQHRKDYAIGAPYGQKRSGLALIFDNKILSDCNGQILQDKIMFKDNEIYITNSDLKKLISQQVSAYATTSSAEYIAEFASLMRQGAIGVKIVDDEIKYYINPSYNDTRQEKCIIDKERFAKLVKLYLLLGGTPEFNDNFKVYNEKVISLSQKEAMETEL